MDFDEKLYNDCMFVLKDPYSIYCNGFGDSVIKGKLKDYQIKIIMEDLKKENYTEKEAIFVITNLAEVAFYVPFFYINFHAYCDDALYYIAGFIKQEGSVNFKIIYALYKSQVDETETKLNINSSRRIIYTIKRYFEQGGLLNEDKEKAYHIKENLNKILKKENKGIEIMEF
ncbi:hypothetical protein PIROE2DRAFT_60793 [Piromyces sp. E2]|nr:hypothetical protein PIROE2DRAFT_60793 [Piromyces sp. E2]|eukprot:OUM64274.1 hypothetical protein PIROE2DRAFT_60793 [Piromyces sp. E2]